jgi:uncharacterized protein
MTSIQDFVKTTLSFDESGHDFAHAERVAVLAQKIQAQEGGNLRIILAAAYVHDTIDSKLFSNTEERLSLLKKALQNAGYSSEEIAAIVTIITHLSWHLHDTSEKSLEAKIVSDADRLEALGAIGIIRTIEYGTSHHRKFYDESNLVHENGQVHFGTSSETTLSHFYDKLLQLEGTFQTPSGEALAKQRIAFLKTFLDEFYAELSA